MVEEKGGTLASPYRVMEGVVRSRQPRRSMLRSVAAAIVVAIIAAVALTLRRRKDTKAIDPGQAVRVKRNDRLKIVKVDTVNQRAIDAANVEKAAAAAAVAAAAAEPKEPK